MKTKKPKPRAKAKAPKATTACKAVHALSRALESTHIKADIIGCNFTDSKSVAVQIGSAA